MTNASRYSWRMPIYAPFTDALPPPSVDPADPDGLVSVCFNKAYLPYLLGALSVYMYDDAFNLTGSPEPDAVQRFTTLIGIFAQALEGCGVFDFDVRQNEENPCILEKFIDGDWVEFANLRLCPPLVRLNIYFQIEVSVDGGETWEVIEDNEIPPVPLPDPEQDGKCVASASVVTALDLTYTEMKRLFQDDVAFYVIVSAAISLLATLIFYPPALPAVIEFFSGIYALLSDIADDSFSDPVKDELKCILFDNATFDGSVTTFNFEAIVADVQDNCNPLAVDIWCAITYLLYIIGEGGLNRAGATGVETEANCGDCGEECYEEIHTTFGEEDWQDFELSLGAALDSFTSHGGVPCVDGRGNYTDGFGQAEQGQITINFPEMTVTGYSFWNTKIGGGDTFYVKFYDTDDVETWSAGNDNFATSYPTWGQILVSGVTISPSVKMVIYWRVAGTHETVSIRIDDVLITGVCD